MTDPCTRCGTRPLEAIGSFLHADGTWSHIMIDPAPAEPTPDLRTVICPVDLRKYCMPNNTDSDIAEGLKRAIARWSYRRKGIADLVRMVGRYMRMWHGVPTVTWRCDPSTGDNYLGALPGNYANEYENQRERVRAVFGDLDTYLAWTRGDVYGVVRTGHDGTKIDAVWGCLGYQSHRAMVEAFYDSPIVQEWAREV